MDYDSDKYKITACLTECRQKYEMCLAFEADLEHHLKKKKAQTAVALLALEDAEKAFNDSYKIEDK